MTGRKKAAFVLRIPGDLHRQLVRKAKESNRSLNEEVKCRLEQSLTLSDIEARQLNIQTLTDTGFDVVRGLEKVLTDIKAGAYKGGRDE